MSGMRTAGAAARHGSPDSSDTGVSPDCLLSVRGLSREREGGGTRFRVSLPRLDLNEGEFCALVGPSGSGKSTLLDLIGLVLEPSTVGRYDLRLGGPGTPMRPLADLWETGAGEDRAAAVRRNAMGYVLQSGGLFPFLSVGENIDLPRRLLRQQVRRAATEAELRQFGLTWGYDKRVAELSGGERQRVAILRALAHGPRIVLADEPTAAVDRNRARDVVATLREYARGRGSAVIMVTHDVSLVRDLADVWIVLKPDPDAGPGETAYRGERVVPK